jgi:tetratricopeptide (TPR) repeat protein
LFYVRGQAAFDAKRFDEAVSAWERSYELSQEPALLFNIGQAYRQRKKAGDCAKAFASYQKFIELDAMSDQRPVAEGFSIEMHTCARESTPLIVTSVAPVQHASTTTVPQPVLPIDTRSGRTKKLAGLAIMGSGAALAATGFYFGRRASSLGNEVTRACRDGCNWEFYGPKDANGRSAQTKQYVFAGLGVAAIVGGGVMYWLGLHAQRTSTFAIALHHDDTAITWSGSW